MEEPLPEAPSPKFQAYVKAAPIGELAAAVRVTGRPTITVEGVAVGLDVNVGKAVIVTDSIAVPVPYGLEAPMVMEEVPNAAGVSVPEINPVELLTLNPFGKPVALKLVGVLLAAIW